MVRKNGQKKLYQRVKEKRQKRGVGFWGRKFARTLAITFVFGAIAEFIVEGVAWSAELGGGLAAEGIDTLEFMAEVAENPERFADILSDSELYMELLADPEVFAEAVCIPEVIADLATEPKAFLEIVSDPEIIEFLNANPDALTAIANHPDMAANPALLSQIKSFVA